jgi:hypothetical protein
MYTPDFYLTVALAGLAAVAMLTTAGLSGWRGWLALKGRELDHMQDAPAMMPAGAGARIEIADLKERIRKLEAIAAGVDL